jgi:hypothetical protein
MQARVIRAGLGDELRELKSRKTAARWVSLQKSWYCVRNCAGHKVVKPQASLQLPITYCGTGSNFR